MTFINTLGLWGLLGIPILILIYIIKNRYTEQTISSTYLWILSEKFLKRKNPLSKITGIISLILQILLVAVLSFAIAHPVIILHNQAYEYCFILDGSASMSMTYDGTTRMDRAKDKICDMIDDAKEGSVFSLIYVDSPSGSTEIFVLNEDKDYMKRKVATLECAEGSIGYVDAIGTAQKYFDENPAVKTYLVTDKDYLKSENIEIINVSSKEVNVSVSDVSYVKENGVYAVSGSIVCYGSTATVDINVYADDGTETVGSAKVNLSKGLPQSFTIPSLNVTDFTSLTVKVDYDDSMPEDNIAYVYDIKNVNSYKTLVVSNSPVFLENVIKVFGNSDVKSMSTADYERLINDEAADSEGYNLYVFEEYTPSVVPTDGAVWFFGPPTGNENSKFTVQNPIELEESSEIEITKNTNSLVKKLTEGITGDRINIKAYIKCGISSDSTVLYTCNGTPVIFTGTNKSGNREAVFAFKFEDTDIALTYDFGRLISNLLEYSFPAVVEETEYFCDDTAKVNVVSGCTKITAYAPSGDMTIVYDKNAQKTAPAFCEFSLNEVGEYRIVAEISGVEREFKLYSSVPLEERSVTAIADSIGIVGEPGEGGRDGKYDDLTIWFILAALLFAAEWVVYCYEKYQLL